MRDNGASNSLNKSARLRVNISKGAHRSLEKAEAGRVLDSGIVERIGTRWNHRTVVLPRGSTSFRSFFLGRVYRKCSDGPQFNEVVN